MTSWDNARVQAIREAARKQIILRVLREQGLDDHGASPHSWRCEHPDRYPDACTCVEDVADAILEALK
jgi:hypothetical protein